MNLVSEDHYVYAFLGGIGIFAGTLFPSSSCGHHSISLRPVHLFVLIIIFLIGAKDDIDPTSPSKKFLGELCQQEFSFLRANVRLTSLYAFGIYEIPELISIVISIFTTAVIINAFNP
ncbi:MAG: hypothetical protein IPP49_07000 [Saprospiraceae bacterium]|nr:hypothetical protein [Saprospiraceae bacterium]